MCTPGISTDTLKELQSNIRLLRYITNKINILHKLAFKHTLFDLVLFINNNQNYPINDHMTN